MVKASLKHGLKFLVSGALIWLMASRIDLAAAGARIVRVQPGMLGMAAIAFLGYYAICGLRWRSVLTSVRALIPAAVALRLMYIGAFFYQTLPASVGGDAVRTFLAYRRGVPLQSAVNGLMLEKVAVFVALILLFALSLPFFPLPLDSSAAVWMTPAAVSLLMVSTGGVGLLAFLDRIPEPLQKWRVVRALASLARDTRTLFFSPSRAFRAIGWSMGGLIVLTLALYVLALGLGIAVTLNVCFALFMPVVLLAALPISIAGWGVREGGMVYAFGLIGVATEDALALSLLFGLVDLIVALPGGIVWIASGSRIKNIADRDPTASELPKEP